MTRKQSARDNGGTASNGYLRAKRDAVAKEEARFLDAPEVEPLEGFKARRRAAAREQAMQRETRVSARIAAQMRERWCARETGVFLSWS